MSSPKRSKRSKPFANKFFDKIFVISLYNNFDRWNKVSKQFKNRKIDVDRFITVDGRCKNETSKECQQKLNTFKIMFDVRMSNKREIPLREFTPAVSLTLSNVILLRQMVKQKWDYILICEDDINLVKNFDNRLKQGIKEIGNYKWDLLYLGCGGLCGDKGVSHEQTPRNKYLSTLAESEDQEYYVENKDDLRTPCDEECPRLSENISKITQSGGSWCIAYSLAGAKKMLKYIDDDVGDHVDYFIAQMSKKGLLKKLAFNPPIAYHIDGYVRSDSSIPWT